MCGCPNIKIKFTEDPPDPSHHFTVGKVYLVVATSPYEDGLVGMAIVDDLGVLKSIRSDNTAFELASVTIPVDKKLYP